MANYDPSQITTSDMANQGTEFSVESATTDGPTGQKETEYLNDRWTIQYGWYKNKKAAKIKKIIDTKATWIIVKGFTADETTTLILDQIKGNGKDTFNTILENQVRVAEISGASYAEIITNDDGYLINLKPLTPEVVKTVSNRKGIIIRYEQINRTDNKTIRKFKPEDIFHLMRNRTADENSGQSLIDEVEWILEAKSEAMEDTKILQHRYVKPRFIVKAKTENTTKLATIQTQMDKAFKNSENLLVPMDALEVDLMAVPSNATLNNSEWRTYLDNELFEAAGMPRIIVGGTGGITERAVTIAYLAWQQTVEEGQLQLEENVLSQLNLVINLTPPASLENDLLSDQKKDGPVNIDPSETTVEGTR